MTYLNSLQHFIFRESSPISAELNSFKLEFRFSYLKDKVFLKIHFSCEDIHILPQNHVYFHFRLNKANWFRMRIDILFEFAPFKLMYSKLDGVPRLKKLTIFSCERVIRILSWIHQDDSGCCKMKNIILSERKILNRNVFIFWWGLKN